MSEPFFSYQTDLALAYHAAYVLQASPTASSRRAPRATTRLRRPSLPGDPLSLRPSARWYSSHYCSGDSAVKLCAVRKNAALIIHRLVPLASGKDEKARSSGRRAWIIWTGWRNAGGFERAGLSNHACERVWVS